VLVACGSGSDGGAGDRGAAPATGGGGPTAAQQQAVAATWVPLGADGHAGDSDADHQVCTDEVNADRRLQDPEDLRRLAALIHCMRAKGWEFKPQS
jgi:hypothetical protein